MSKYFWNLARDVVDLKDLKSGYKFPCEFIIWIWERICSTGSVKQFVFLFNTYEANILNILVVHHLRGEEGFPLTLAMNVSEKNDGKSSNHFLMMPTVFSKLYSLRKKCPYLELFWSTFSRIWTEYGESEWGKMRTRITPNTDTFHVV